MVLWRNKRAADNVTTFAVLMGLVVSSFLAPSVFADEVEDKGPWGNYKEKNADIIKIFYDHIGKDATVPQGNDAGKSEEWLENEVKKYNPTAFNNISKCRRVDGNNKYYYTSMIVFPEGSKYKTTEERLKAIGATYDELENLGYPGFYGDLSREKIKYYIGVLREDNKKALNQPSNNETPVGVACSIFGTPGYIITSSTQPKTKSLSKGQHEPMNVTIGISLDYEGKYLSKYDEKLNGTIDITYTGPEQVGKKVITKNVTFNKNDKTVTAPTIYPKDFGLDSWPEGVFTYKLNVPKQGILTEGYVSNPNEVAVNVRGNQKVTPIAPTKAGNTVTVTPTVGVNYTINGQEIKFDKNGKPTFELKPNQEVTIIATPAGGYEFHAGVISQWKFVGDKILVTPTKPTNTINYVTVTKTPGVEYVVDGEKVDFKGGDKVTIPLKPNQKITVVATPDADHVFDGPQSKEWEFAGDRNVVTPAAPTKKNNTVIITRTPGVEYVVDGEKVTTFGIDGKVFYPLSPNQKITVVATPDKDHVFADGDLKKEWEFTGDRNTVTPVAPTKSGNVVTLTATHGVDYFVDGEKIDFGDLDKVTIPLKPNEKLVVIATPDKDHVFADSDLKKEWAFTGDRSIVIPIDPIKTGNTVTITKTPGVNYSVDGEKVDFKDKDKVTFTIGDGKELTVIATPADEDYKFDGDEQSKDWKFTWVTPPTDTKQSDTPKPKPAPVDTKQSDTPKPVDVKQSGKPKLTDTKQSDKAKPAPAVVKPVERDNTPPKRHAITNKVDKKQSSADSKQSSKPADSKQSGDLKKKEALPNTGAGVVVAGSIAVAAVLFGVGVVVARRRVK